jgi:hypothetical protein
MIQITAKAKKAFQDVAAKAGADTQIYRIVTMGFG